MRQKTEFFNKIKSYCINTITIQLFLFFLSFPIILSWGIPVSIMTLISTPLFGPFLTIFLFISALIFPCVLLSIPYTFLLKILDWFVFVWDYILSLSSPNWLYGFAIPHQGIMSIWGICNVVFLLYILKFSMLQRLRLLLCYGGIIMFFLLLYACVPRQSTVSFQSKSGSIEFFFKNQNVIIIDNNFFARQKSSDSWISYTLLPTLITHNGNMHIDAIVITKISKQIISMLQTLLNHCTITHIILPFTPNSTKDLIFNSLIDKVTTHCGIISFIEEQHVLYAIKDFDLHMHYNQKKKRLEIEERHGTKKGVIYYRF